VLMMKPHRDLAYHLGDPELQRMDGATFERRARTNAYVELTGTIVPATLAERRSILDRSFGFLFAVEGYPRTLIVHLTEGPLFSRLTRAGEKNAAAGLLEAIKKPVTLRGRLYDGDNILEPFEEYALRDEADPDSYVREILEDRIDTTPDVITRLDGKEPDPRRWWLLAVGEEPAPGHLWETHLPVFGVGILMGLGAIVALVVVLGRKPPRQPPTGPWRSPAGPPSGPASSPPAETPWRRPPAR
ncbi:MAG: hypothetical protein QF464_21135, partial [Myxococcota bacterium]|nr:hypothetical protein [Myxococcota bacterium]